MQNDVAVIPPFYLLSFSLSLWLGGPQMGSSPIDFPAYGYKFAYLLAEKSCATNLHLFVQICV